jgi:hypothetical protein
MKLTNYIRDAFVSSAMNDLPKTDPESFEKRVTALVQADAVKQLPPKLQAIWKDKALREYMHVHRFFPDGSRYGGGVSVPVPCVGDMTGLCRSHTEFKLSPEARAAVDALIAEKAAEDKRLHDLRQKVRGVAYGVNTRKALLEALPEFERYLPADEGAAIRTLPCVANVIADFRAAGWKTPKEPVAA